MINTTTDIGWSGLGTALPGPLIPLESLPVQSPKETLRGFGFDGAHLSPDAGSMALEATRTCLHASRLSPEQIDVLLTANALPAGQHRPSEQPQAVNAATLSLFCYQSSWLQEILALDNATVCGISQQGCAGLFSALNHARALLIADQSLNHILCVGADALPEGASREVLYNVISDAACACIVSRKDVRYRWIGYHQISNGYYWDIPAKQSEIIAAYYPTATRAIHTAFKKSNLTPSEIDLIIPTGINQSSWPILLRLCGLPEEKLYTPARRFGHTIAADSFLILEEAEQSGVLRPGMKILLFAYGFGSSWSALILETTDLIAS